MQLLVKNKYGKVMAVVEIDEHLTIEIPNSNHAVYGEKDADHTFESMGPNPIYNKTRVIKVVAREPISFRR